MNNTTHALRCFPAEDGFTTIRADNCRNCFDTNWFAIDVKDFAHKLLACLSFATNMAAKHDQLRLE